jgi:hypothetical protein
MSHPKDIGDRAMLAVMLALQSLGYAVLIPFGENTRYDLIADTGERLLRVQCKSGRLRKGAIVFKACSSYAHHPNPRIVSRSYGDEVDCFAVFCPATAGVYLIPIDDLPNRWEATLRVDPPRNRQRAGIRQARDFQIAEVAIELAPLAASAGELETTARG